MKEQDFLENQLKHKKRCVHDLVRFIKTRAGKASNFSLLLGSGCSVTSGIRSGGQLVEKWLRELYEIYFPNASEEDLEKIREQFKQKHGDWYNPSHEYSSLFERRFDLAAQRRSFVEEEVGGKFPSLGYAYLIRLVEEHYFNTIFTTNFDDLINEAFHLFADSVSETNEDRDLMRPIVCAHDSSVKSISISSARPKIIKLHGDYLFEDIKSTLIETESLEENIRNKFVEFSKEYGLIVVGYSGTDRSVMDVLNYLLKSEDYLKHGLYWCLRKDDYVSDELKKLLWKERVYYVYVDGFDELFAELYQNVMGRNSLPIPQTLPNKSNIIIERLANNNLLKASQSAIIKDVLERLNSESQKNYLFNTMKDIMFPNGNIDDFQGFSSNETLKLFEIDKLRNSDRDEEALTQIEIILSSSEYSFSFKNKLKHIAAHILKKLNKIEQALEYCDKIIKDNKGNPDDFLFKNKFLPQYQDKINNLKECAILHEYYFKLYEKIVHYEARLLLQPLSNHDELLTEFIDDVNKGIACNPYLENKCYIEKFSLIMQQRNLYSSKWFDEAKEICEIAEKQNKNHPLVYDYKRQLILANLKLNSQQKRQELLTLWEEIFSKTKKHFDIYIGQCVLMLNESIADAEKISEVEQLMEQNEDRLCHNSRYISIFANFYAKKCGKVTKAITLWKNISEEEYDLEDLETLKLFYCMVDRRDDFEQLSNRVKGGFNAEGQARIELLVAETKKDYEKVLTAINKLEQFKTHKYEFFTQKMYAFLCLNKFRDVFDESKEMLNDIVNVNDRSACDIINYEIARDKIKEKIQKEKLNDILTQKPALRIQVAANLLLDNYAEAEKQLKEDILFDHEAIYSYLNTFIFIDRLNDETKQFLRDKFHNVI